MLQVSIQSNDHPCDSKVARWSLLTCSEVIYVSKIQNGASKFNIGHYRQVVDIRFDTCVMLLLLLNGCIFDVEEKGL